MNEDRSFVFEEFKRGMRPLFIVRKKDVSFAEMTWRDIVVQKWDGGVRMMFWEHSAAAESFILQREASADFEVHLITTEELWAVATRIWGAEIAAKFPYFLCA